MQLKKLWKILKYLNTMSANYLMIGAYLRGLRPAPMVTLTTDFRLDAVYFEVAGAEMNAA